MAISNAGMAPWMLQAAIAAHALKNPLQVAQMAAAQGVEPPPIPQAPPSSAQPNAVPPAVGGQTAPPVAAPAMATPPMPAVPPTVGPPIPGSTDMPMVGRPGMPGGDVGTAPAEPSPFAFGSDPNAALAFGAIRPPTPTPNPIPQAHFGNLGGGFRPGAQQIMQLLMQQAPQTPQMPSLGALIRGVA